MQNWAAHIAHQLNENGLARRVVYYTTRTERPNELLVSDKERDREECERDKKRRRPTLARSPRGPLIVRGAPPRADATNPPATARHGPKNGNGGDNAFPPFPVTLLIKERIGKREASMFWMSMMTRIRWRHPDR